MVGDLNILTEKQQKVLKKMLISIENKKNYFLSSADRNIGKTFTLNKLAFTLQALGYVVYILTPYKEQEYFTHKFISLEPINFKEKLNENVVIIADEARFEMMEELLDCCKYKRIPVVGYVNFMRFKPIKIEPYKTEYQCQ